MILSLLKILLSILYSVTAFITCSTTEIIAGPAAKADARNRGPISGLFQNGRAGSPWYKNAVTIWIEKAQKIDKNTKGRYFRSSALRPI